MGLVSHCPRCSQPRKNTTIAQTVYCLNCGLKFVVANDGSQTTTVVSAGYPPSHDARSEIIKRLDELRSSLTSRRDAYQTRGPGVRTLTTKQAQLAASIIGAGPVLTIRDVAGKHFKNRILLLLLLICVIAFGVVPAVLLEFNMQRFAYFVAMAPVLPLIVSFPVGLIVIRDNGIGMATTGVVSFDEKRSYAGFSSGGSVTRYHVQRTGITPEERIERIQSAIPWINIGQYVLFWDLVLYFTVAVGFGYCALDPSSAPAPRRLIAYLLAPLVSLIIAWVIFIVCRILWKASQGTLFEPGDIAPRKLDAG